MLSVHKQTKKNREYFSKPCFLTQNSAFKCRHMDWCIHKGKYIYIYVYNNKNDNILFTLSIIRHL